MLNENDAEDGFKGVGSFLTRGSIGSGDGEAKGSETLSGLRGGGWSLGGGLGGGGMESLEALGGL